MSTKDGELAAAFAELRAADEKRASTFARTLAVRHPSDHVRRPSPALVLSTGAAVLVAFALCVNRSPRGPTPNIAEWRPPTDVLLEVARPAVLQPMAPLGASVLDPMLPSRSPNGAP